MILREIQEVVRECGQLMLRADHAHAGVENKGKYNDLVTRYDKAIQDILQKRLLDIAPDAHFLGEEENVHESIAKGRAFVVDPIDGTTNFVKDYKCSVISVAMTMDGEVTLGVIYNPYLDEMYTAQKGKGASCNGIPIHVSDHVLHEGIVLYGSASYYRELIDESFRLLRLCADEAMDIRRSGSAAWDLCTIAAGRAEMFFELRLQPWDFAAGSLLVTEAGGTVTCVDGSPITIGKPCSILAKGTQVDDAFMRK